MQDDSTTPDPSGSASLTGSGSGVPRPSSWRNKKLGKFRLLSLLGQGAMGRVFLAEDTKLQRQVAIKVLAVPRDSPSLERKNQQFLREARAAAALSHPHVVGVLEVGEHKKVVYIAMDLVEGGDVKRLIATGGPLPVGRACDLAADAAEGLAFAHEMGVVHRDVKPANLMLDRRGRVKLADFGLADPGDPNDTFRLRDGVIGTPGCMAPEVARGEKATPASDQYSLACTLWQMLTGKPLFAGDNFQHVLEKQVRAVPPALGTLVPAVPATLAEAVHKALAKDPAERHRSCEDFGRILRGHAVALGPAGISSVGSASVAIPAVAAKPSTGPKALIVGGVLAAAALLGGVAVWVATRGEPAAVVTAEPEPVAVEPPEPEPVPEAVAPPAPVAPAPPPPAPGGSFDVMQAPRLALAIGPGLPVEVTGRIVAVERSPVDGRMTARFEGIGPKGFWIWWPIAAEPGLASAFGGDAGAGLAGRTVAVRGAPSWRFGRVAIRVTDPAAIRPDF